MFLNRSDNYNATFIKFFVALSLSFPILKIAKLDLKFYREEELFERIGLNKLIL